MKETRTINLNGLVFHIDNDAYRSLNDYLQDIELRLPQDEREDVMADVEARVCELLQSALFAKNVQVVDIEMINAIKARIGAPSDFGENKRPRIKHRPQSERSGCGRVLKITLVVLLILLAVQVLLPILAGIFAISLAGLGLGVGAFGVLPMFGVPFFDGNWGMALLMTLAALVMICLPVYAIIHSVVTYMRTRKGPSGRFWLISIICWIISIGCFAIVLKKQAPNFAGWQRITQVVQQLDDEDEPAQDAVLMLPYFNAINAGGAMDLTIKQGEQNVVVSDSGSLVIEVKDSVLCITRKEGSEGFVHAEIALPELTLLSLSGASKAEVEGAFEKVQYVISGASKLDAEDAPTKIVHVNCSGASKASVYAEKELWAQANGASKISYSGKPVVKRNMAVGASKIRKE